MFNRPKRGENEDDILDMQKAYLEEKSKNVKLEPAAKLVYPKREVHFSDLATDQSSKPRKKSIFAERRALASTSKNAETTINKQLLADVVKKDVKPKEDNVFYPELRGNIVGDIVERMPTKACGIQEDSQERTFNTGFPEISRINIKTPVAGKSIFAQQLAQKRKISSSNSDSISEVKENAKKNYNVPSSILTDADKVAIDEQNKVILSNMTTDEILEERNKLMSTLDKDILEFIKTKYKSNSVKNKKDSNNQAIHEFAMDIDEHTPEISPTNETSMATAAITEVVSHPGSNSWLHFDTCEAEKLKWTADVIPKPLEKPGATYEARFDLHGVLLDYSDEQITQTELYHHGEEPHRPGYSLVELFKLCRSQVPQQRSIALNCISGILERHTLGSYWFLNLPLAKIFFLLRFAMDDNTPALVQPAVKAMCALFWNPIDEACLDASIHFEDGLLQPLYYKLKDTVQNMEESNDILDLKSEDADTDEITDYHLAETDLIQCALRTDLLPRIRYILTTIRPNYTTVEYCLHILIRLTRESEIDAVKIINCEGLLDCIIHNFITENLKQTGTKENAYGTTVTAAIKLIRILISHSKNIAEQILNRYQTLISSLQNYISAVFEVQMACVLLQIEAMNTWTAFLHYGLAHDSFIETSPVITRLLDWHVRSTNIRSDNSSIVHSHGAALVSLIGAGPISEHCTTFLVSGLLKWCQQICLLTEYTCGHLRLISAGFVALSNIISSRKDIVLQNKILKDIKRLNDRYVIQMLQSSAMAKLAANLKKSSCLLSKIPDPVQPSGALPQLGGCLPNTKDGVPPCLGMNSPMPLFAAVTKYFVIVSENQFSSDLFNIQHIKDYLKLISSSELFLTRNWFTKIELRFLINLMKLSIKKPTICDQTIIYNTCYKLTYLLSEEHTEDLNLIMKEIIFNKNWFSDEIRIKNLNMKEDENILNNLDDIAACYINVLGVNQHYSYQSLSLSNWSNTILPIDWPYMPIVGLYSKSQTVTSSTNCNEEKQQIAVIKRCLQWILISEIFIPHLTAKMTSTDRFCRLLCVFLCHNSIFLESDIKTLLEQCTMKIFEIEKKQPFNFDKPLQGLSSFADLYTQLLEQFQGVSYGDETFAACVLVPLAQHHNISWRKQVWSEYAAVLRVLTCPENKLCYPLESYINPPETDESLLFCYKMAMQRTLRRNTIPYKIASYHLNAVR